MSTQTFDKNPPVFSFQRSMLVTDGAFFNQIDGRFENHPLTIVRHGLRGTQNVNETKGDSSKDGERNVSNIQQTESAKTDHNAEAAVVTFGIRLLDLKHSLFACAAEDVATTNAVRASVEGFVERAKASEGLMEICRRTSRNIANGSWLWRNRTSASEIEIAVLSGETTIAKFDAFTVPMNHFREYTTDEIKVAEILAEGLRGNRAANLEVRATIRFGVKGSVEVFPSQAYIEDKPTGFARPLYKIAGSSVGREAADPTNGVRVMGQAGLRDQKISNRLRTIDTWYADFEAVGKPIPVEPMGASLEYMQFFRSDKKNASSFGLLARLNTLDPASDEGMFAIASIMRGGVFGEKADKLKKSKGGAAVDETAAESA